MGSDAVANYLGKGLDRVISLVRGHIKKFLKLKNQESLRRVGEQRQVKWAVEVPTFSIKLTDEASNKTGISTKLKKILHYCKVPFFIITTSRLSENFQNLSDMKTRPLFLSI
jgi:hypothetical protein